MSSARESFSELVSLTQLYLLQEHSLTDRVFDSLETFEYFRLHAQQQAKPPAVIRTNPPPVQEHQYPLKKIEPATPLPAIQTPAQPPAPVSTQTLPPFQASPQTKTLMAPSPAAPAALISPPPAKKSTPDSIKPTALLVVEPLPSPPAIDLQDLRKTITEKVPHLKWTEHVPDDTEARKLARSWTQEKDPPQVIILSFNESPAHYTFLSNVAKAIETLGYTVQICKAGKIDQENGWDSLLGSQRLRLIIAGSAGVYALPGLEKRHRENQKTAHHYLGECSLLLLSDISFYLQEPALKRSLWSAIKELLPTVPNAS